ncbi:nucleoside recognition domain-containing protein [Pantoea sp. S62]|uniref:nucleoside recognition domain-containing protein n=1 Tax=Pantoea sp. S62 TaxID=2769342 RepID=UPI001912AFD2|nr:nucleoside recognition domain-containing protein [Pantoea sp. S62]MBK5016725.1 ferrous iron transporter B [Pantoea sp. S62]
MKNVALIGFESTGKSSLFNLLTRSSVSDERNFRGSSIICREKSLENGQVKLIDTPGIRYKSDNATTELALSALQRSDTVVVVMRATDAFSEWEKLTPLLQRSHQKLSIVLTFADKVIVGLEQIIRVLRESAQVPVMALDVRRASEEGLQQLLRLIEQAGQPGSLAYVSSGSVPVLNISTHSPQQTWFEHPQAGPLLALIAVGLLFAVPVWAAWYFSSLLQPLVEVTVINPIENVLSQSPTLLQALLTGSYGLISLGIYSFIWAFPVVLFMAFSVAIAEDSGIKERIIFALDPWLCRIGLNGTDMIPLLSGFGCNVVAVFQTRSCSRCSRQNCISTIAFGLACSYQMGATLSLFSAAGHPALFAPYLLLLFITGCVHTRLWRNHPVEMTERLEIAPGWLQWPRWRALRWSVKNSLSQFLLQAMPLFLIICVTGGLLDYLTIIDALSHALAPVAAFFHLPAEVLPGIIFSLIRKDGLMVLNQDSGALIQALTLPQLILLVWIASTLMACLVTILTIAREISWRFAARLAAKQAVSSLVTAMAMTLIFIK